MGYSENFKNPLWGGSSKVSNSSKAPLLRHEYVGPDPWARTCGPGPVGAGPWAWAQVRGPVDAAATIWESGQAPPLTPRDEISRKGKPLAPTIKAFVILRGPGHKLKELKPRSFHEG